MARLIDADALYEKLIYGTTRTIAGGGEYIAVWRIADAINDAPTIEQPQWISCAERLPTEAGFYRVCHESGTIADRYFYGDCELFTKFGSDPVTHWKPIEEPPKGDE